MLSFLVKKYFLAKHEVESSKSARRKLFYIIDFFRTCERVGHFPPHKTFIYEFTPYLIEIFRASYINFISPDYLNSVKTILSLSKDAYIGKEGQEVIESGIYKTIDNINLQLFKTYFYLGELEEGLAILNGILKQSKRKIDEEDKTYQPDIKNTYNGVSGKNEYALVNPERYKENKAFEILSELRNELDKINSWSDTEINTLLVESYESNDGNAEYQGIVQSMLCNIYYRREKKNLKISFLNTPKKASEEFFKTFDNIQSNALIILKYLGENVNFYNEDINLKYTNTNNIYRGTSFGLGASVLIACNYFKYKDRLNRYKISYCTAFTGSVDAEGNVIPVSEESLQAKVEAAFFSWIKYCIIPEANYKAACEAYKKLRRHNPSKILEIIPVSKVTDVFDKPEIILKEKIGYNNYIENKFNRHKTIAITLIILIVAVLSFFVSNIFIRKNIKDLPITSSENNYIIFAPDRDTSWIFQNRDISGADTINFGDVAIGDFWSPRLIFVNNSYAEEKFEINILGNDKEEFELTWMYDKTQPIAPNTLKPDYPVTSAIKFVPTKTEGIKSAYIEFKSVTTGITKKIYLTGKAGKNFKGYSLALMDKDDDLLFEPGMNLIDDNFTLSFWIKPLNVPDIHISRHILCCDKNPLTNNKFALLITNDTLIHLNLASSKTGIIPRAYISSKTKLRINDWNFIAITYSDSIISLILNDEYISKNIGLSALRKFNDCIYFNNHPEQSLKKNWGSIQLQRYVDMFCIYNKGINPEQLIRNRFTENQYRDRGLVLCWDFDDSHANQVFDKSSNDYWPKYYGGVNRVLDKPPIAKSNLNSNNSKNTNINHVFKRSNNGLARYNKKLFKDKSSFTIQCDFKIDSISYVNSKSTEKSGIPFFFNRGSLDMLLQINNEQIKFELMNTYNKYVKDDYYNYRNNYKWNRYTFTYDIVNNCFKVYLNGEKIFSDIFPDTTIDITMNYMGISFGVYHYFTDPRIYECDTYIDNIKIFNRPISQEEIFSEVQNGLISYWTFEKTDGVLAYDEINNLPLIMWQDYEIVEEEIQFEK